MGRPWAPFALESRVLGIQAAYVLGDWDGAASTPWVPAARRQQAADQFKRLGVRDVTLTLWPDARHEILHETNRDEVEVEILEWLDAHLETAQAPA